MAIISLLDMEVQKFKKTVPASARTLGPPFAFLSIKKIITRAFSNFVFAVYFCLELLLK
jgi:hypothetical protein